MKLRNKVVAGVIGLGLIAGGAGGYAWFQNQHTSQGTYQGTVQHGIYVNVSPEFETTGPLLPGQTYNFAIHVKNTANYAQTIDLYTQLLQLGDVCEVTYTYGNNEEVTLNPDGSVNLGNYAPDHQRAIIAKVKIKETTTEKQLMNGTHDLILKATVNGVQTGGTFDTGRN